MAKYYDKQFKPGAVQYYHNHKDLGLQDCDSNLGMSHQTLSRWRKNCVKQVILKAVVPVAILLLHNLMLQLESI